MKWNNKFNYPKSSRSIENGMRKYLFDDEKLPSVTSILQATKSDEDKAALENWKQRVGIHQANKIKTEASSRGYGMETTLRYPQKYGGTADLVGIYQGKETIVDFKQANKPKKVDYIQDYFLQLGAYTLAHNVVYKTNITSGVILLCTVDNLFQDFIIEGAELLMYQNLFLGRIKKFNEMNNLS